jgi:hypothetical protein
MTGYQSKKAAALDEEGMYLVHHTKGRTFDKFGNKVTNDDDDTQVYQRPWVGLTDEEFDFFVPYCHNEFDLNDYKEFARDIEAKLKEKNT